MSKVKDRKKRRPKAVEPPPAPEKGRGRGKPTRKAGRRQAASTEGVLAEVQVQNIRDKAGEPARDWTPPTATWRTDKQDQERQRREAQQADSLGRLIESLEKQFKSKRHVVGKTRAADPKGARR